MRLEISRLLFPFLLLGAVAGSLQAAGAAPEPGNTLGDDDRLLKKITLRRPDATLRSLLDEIGQATGTKLTPPRDLAEQKFTLFFRDRPAARVMAVLAEYLDRKWARKGDGYELFADRAAQQRESEHARAPLARMFAELDQRIAFSRLPAAEIERLYELHVGDPDWPKLSPRQREALGLWSRRVAGFRAGPRPRGMSQVWRSLTPAHIEGLKSGATLRWHNRDGSMPPEVTAAFVRERLAYRSDVQAEKTAGVWVTMALADGLDDEYAPGIPPAMGLFVRTRLSLTLPDGRETDGGAYGVEQPERFRAPLPTPHLHTALDRPFSPPPLAWPSRFSGLSADLQARAAEMERKWRDDPPLSLLLEQLHTRTGLDICSDSFVRVRTPIETPSPGKLTFRQYLNQHSERLDYAWTLRDDCLWFRSSFYYLDRPREPPPEAIAKLRAELGQQPERQLELLAKASHSLTPNQLRGLADHWPWHMAGDPLWIPVPREAPGPWNRFPGMLALYGSLPEPAQAAVKGGKSVPAPRSPLAIERLQQDLVRRNSRVDQPKQWVVGPQTVLRAEVEEREYIAYEDVTEGEKGITTGDVRPGYRPRRDRSGRERQLLAPPIGITKTRMLLEAPGAAAPEILTVGFFHLYKPVRRTEPLEAPAG